MKNKILWLLVIACAVTSPVFSASLEELLPAATAARLRTGGSVSEVQLRNPVPRLMPRHAELQRFINETINNLGSPSVMVETLYRYQKPAASAAGFISEIPSPRYAAARIVSLGGLRSFAQTRMFFKAFTPP